MTARDDPSTDLLALIARCTEMGKDSRTTPYPPEMEGEDGVDELTERALASGMDPNEVLSRGLMVGMDQIGRQFAEKNAFVPQLLLAARAMSRGMERLEPYFQSGEATRKGTLVLGVVRGDLHDIGKNLVRMMVEGAGWEVVDLGVDAPPERFLEGVDEHPRCVVGVGALLTTTMTHMGDTVEALRQRHPATRILVGGAPVNEAFARDIGAHGYLQDAQAVREYLTALGDSGP